MLMRLFLYTWPDGRRHSIVAAPTREEALFVLSEVAPPEPGRLRPLIGAGAVTLRRPTSSAPWSLEEVSGEWPERLERSEHAARKSVARLQCVACGREEEATARAPARPDDPIPWGWGWMTVPGGVVPVCERCVRTVTP